MELCNSFGGEDNFRSAKGVPLDQVIPVSNKISNIIEKILSYFIWNNNQPKIKQNTICENTIYFNPLSAKIHKMVKHTQANRRHVWVCLTIFRDWRLKGYHKSLVSLYSMKGKFSVGKRFIFHFNISIKNSIIAALLDYRKKFVWKVNFSHTSEFHSF